MFNFLKEKIKGAVERITEKIREQPPETKEERIVPIKKKEEEPKKTKEQALKQEKKKEVQKEEIKAEKDVSKKEEKKGFFTKVKEKFSQEETPSFFEKVKTSITTTKISAEQFQDLFWELELALLENNVALEVIEKLKEDLKKEIVDKNIKRSEVETIITETLKESINTILTQETKDIAKEVKKKKPYVICFLGINGSGKTTTIGKIAYLLKEQGFSSVMVAADTFRSAAIEQLEEWGKRTQTKVIKQDYGSDPAAVAFDGIKHAKAKGIDVVLIDTAGRLHSNKNLMEELKKIIRIAQPDLKIFVGESITGNDCIEQVQQFNEAIGIDGIILTKVDVDEKGGTALSIAYVTKKPIIYVGLGQQPQDLKPFNKETILQNIGLK